MFELREYFDALRAHPDRIAGTAAGSLGPVTVMGRALADTRGHFSAAARHLAEAQRQSVEISGPAGEPGRHLHAAGAHLSVSREVLDSHRGPDGDPLTPYLFLLATEPAQLYVVSRVVDLAWETGRVAGRLAERTENPGVAAALSAAQQELDRAVVLGRRASSGMLPEFGELPLNPPLTSRSGTAPDLPGAVDRIAEDCDRLVRGTFQAARGTGRPMSGTDLRDIGRSLVLSHLLAGRTLLHVAANQIGPDGEHMRRTADGLREAARHWQRLGASFTCVVDITDPRDHPTLPRWGYADVRAGRVSPMPRTQPHPATAIAHAISLHIGHLLHGEQWRPAAPRPPRPAAAVVADSGGLGPLLRALHQLPSVARQLAEAGPHLLRRTQHNLVTDSAEYRAPQPERRLRWYSVSARQLDALNDAYHAIVPAQEKAAALLAESARTVGGDVPRARLDAAARRLVRPGPPDASPPKVPGINAPAVAKPARSREPQYRLPHTRHDIDARLQAAYQPPGRPPMPARPQRPGPRPGPPPAI
ncbi:hypothetical protein [Streptomyces marincola]|uniref:hypothetical protein n=1 Tax=Streptomyces marincola TaxID=2878388 RepID=UPI001CF5459A|nr:hypothetical protein [Streptomyces marincola]UCM88019.1 hypothetical protein LC193_08655 [Streptomyces marincola]